MKIHPSVGSCFILGLLMLMMLILIASFYNPAILLGLVPAGWLIALRKSMANWIKTHP
mgnify:FL=1